MHSEGPGFADRKRNLLEVESVAYIVCDALGLETGDYSFAYVARWSGGDLELVKQSAARVIDCTKRILERLEADAPRVGR